MSDMSAPHEQPKTPEAQVLEYLRGTLALFRRNAADLALAKACLAEEERVCKRLERLLAPAQSPTEEAA